MPISHTKIATNCNYTINCDTFLLYHDYLPHIYNKFICISIFHKRKHFKKILFQTKIYKMPEETDPSAAEGAIRYSTAVKPVVGKILRHLAVVNNYHVSNLLSC